MPTDRFDQYSEDQPITTLGDYSYRVPQHPYAHAPRRGAAAWPAGGGSAPAGGGGATATARRRDLFAKTAGEQFQQRWRESAERAGRIREHVEGQRSWSGSPDDYNDVIAPPGRGGGMSTVTNGPRLTGLRSDDDLGGAGVPARPKPTNGGNGNGLSGGATEKVPTVFGGYF